MSRVRSDPVASPQVEASPNTSATPPKKAKGYRKRGGKIDWDRVKVFKEAEYRFPYRLGVLTPGKRSKNLGSPDPWLLAAIESGLVETVSRDEVTAGGEWLTPLGDHPPARMKPGALEQMIAEGIQELLLINEQEELKKDTKD